MKHATLFIIGLIAFLGIQAQNKGQLIDQIIGTVGNEIVLQSELETQLLQYKEQGLPTTPALKTQIVEDLLFQKLLLHHARIDSLEVTEASILSEIDRRLEYYISVFGSIDEFENYFGQSVSEWKAELRDPIEEQLLIQQMQAEIDDRVSATPSQVKEFFDNLPPDSIPLINSEIEYAKIELKPRVPLEEKERARNFLDSIRQEVIGGYSMSLAAFSHSEDPGSKYKGGCYEGVQRGQFVPEFEAAVFATGEGGYSPVFESDFGYHFVYVKEIRGEVYSPCHVLVKPKVSQSDVARAKFRADSIVNAVRKGDMTFERAAIRYSTDEESANQEGAVTNVRTGGFKHDVSGIDPKVFFVLDKLQEGEMADPILEIDPVDGTEKYLIYKVTQRTEAHRANLRQDYVMFQRQAESILRNESLEEWISEKISKTYISLEDEIKNLNFKNNWKQNPG